MENQNDSYYVQKLKNEQFKPGFENLVTPDATMVASYISWKNNFHRHVKKGEKAIRVIAPIKIKDETDNDALESIRFKSVCVYDISQTDGEPLPPSPVQQLEGDVEGYKTLYHACILTSPVPVSFKDLPSGTNGAYYPDKQKIVLQRNLSQTQAFKTLIHEIAHARLSHNAASIRDISEIEAESVAYIVMSAFCIDTSSYSFPYIALWAKNCSNDELMQTIKHIRSTAERLITEIENNLNLLQEQKEEIYA